MAIDPAQSLSSPTEDSPSTQPMVGKGWVQAVALVLIFGFFVMGILAYRTYTASMPMPDKVVTELGPRCCSPVPTSPAAKSLSGARPARIRIGGRARGLPRPRLHRRLSAPCRPTTSSAQFRAQGRRRPALRGGQRLPNQPLRHSHQDPDLHRRAGRRLRPHRRATTRTSSAPRSHNNGLLADLITDPADIHDLTVVLRMDGVGRCRRAARAQLQLHQQLAGRTPRGQRADRSVGRLVGAVAHRAARRHRNHVRGIRPLEPEDRLAQRRGADAVLPPARRGAAHPLSARHDLVLRDHFGAVPGPGAAGRRRCSTTGPT